MNTIRQYITVSNPEYLMVSYFFLHNQNNGINTKSFIINEFKTKTHVYYSYYLWFISDIRNHWGNVEH